MRKRLRFVTVRIEKDKMSKVGSQRKQKEGRLLAQTPSQQ